MSPLDNLEPVKGFLSLLDHYIYGSYLEGSLENSPSPFQLDETRSSVREKGYTPTARWLLRRINHHAGDRWTLTDKLGLGSIPWIEPHHLYQALLQDEFGGKNLTAACEQINSFNLSDWTKNALCDLLRIYVFLAARNKFDQGKLLPPRYRKLHEQRGITPTLRILHQEITQNDKKAAAKLLGIKRISFPLLTRGVLNRPADELDLKEAICRIDPPACTQLESTDFKVRNFRHAVKTLGRRHWQELGSPRNYNQLVRQLNAFRYPVSRKNPRLVEAAVRAFRNSHFIYHHKTSPVLEVVTGENQQHYYIDLDQEQGEKQLYGLAEKFDVFGVEEGFLYTEFTLKGRLYKRWYEAAVKERRGYCYISLSAIDTLLYKKAKIHKVAVYHIHPQEPYDLIPSTDDMFSSLKSIPETRKNYGGEYSESIIRYDGKFSFSVDLKQKNIEKALERSTNAVKDAIKKALEQKKKNPGSKKKPYTSAGVAKKMSNFAVKARYYPRKDFHYKLPRWAKLEKK